MHGVGYGGGIQDVKKKKNHIGIHGEIPQIFGQADYLLVACLQTQGLYKSIVDYLGGSRPLYKCMRASLGVPVQQGDSTEGIQGPSIDRMAT